MSIDSVYKKLREAAFFLNKMREQEGRAFGDREPFDFYLNAFLNAGRTVDNRLRHLRGDVYRTWRKRWNDTHPDEDKLMEFIHNERAGEVHDSGSSRDARMEDLEVCSYYEDASGRLEVFAPPAPLGFPRPAATISKPAYYLTDVDGQEQKATELCDKYLSVLRTMVDEFAHNNP